ncbi:hypothetical protein JL721_13002 [Aureococcus anophagefferens]|nr:hypothetical protein JL721_13002 [Aureococcus anophagefferens]
MEKSSMESETPAAAVDVEDADDDSVEIAFLDDDDDDDESDGGAAAAPADEAAAAGDAGDVPDVDFGDDGGSSRFHVRPRAPPTAAAASLGRRRAVAFDGDGEPIVAAAPVDDGDATWATTVAPVAGFALKTKLRLPDDLDCFALRAPPHYRATWVRLASALRTDNKVKLKIYADKGKKAALSQPSIEGHELVTRAEARIKYHTFVLCCEECEKCTDIKEVRAVADMLAGHKDVDVGRERAGGKRGDAARCLAIRGDDSDISYGGQGFCVNPDQIAMVLENARDLKFEPAILEALERKREACACLKSKWDPDWDDASRDPEQVMHQLHVFGAGDKRANGEYCRLVCCRGRDRLGDDTRPDEWCEAFNVYDEWNDAPVYVHALHKKIMLRREKINGGSRGWAVVENVDDRAHILYACFTDDLSPPFQKRAWRAYKGSPPNPQVSSTTIQEFCLARKAEGNLAYAASLDPDNRFPFDEAISAEELYTEAVEMFHDGMPVDRGLKISLYLNRAENRLTRLQPLHRARGWEARDENEWERSQRDFVRDALRDCDFALQLAEDFVVDDEPDARPWVKRAKVKVALGDLLGAKADLRAALALGGKNPKIRRTAALVNASIKAQEAKERDSRQDHRRRHLPAPDFGGGVNKTLVIVGGASIANAKYAPLGRAIQRFAAANNLSLWALVHGSSYAGLVLLGSYLSTVYGCDVASFPKPVLTLGGELDGLTRVTRLARELASLEAAAAAGGERAKFDKPVGLALGVSHSQFASGVNVTSFGVKDLRPAVTEGAAHAAIGEIVAAFLAFQAFGTAARPDALVAVAVAVDELNATLAPFRAADDAGRCAAWQRSLAANVSRRSPSTRTTASLAGFDLANPDIAGAAVRRRAPRRREPSGLPRRRPSSVDCKALPGVPLAHFNESAAAAPPTRAAANAAASPPRELLEGTRRPPDGGRTVRRLSDRTVATGLGWQAAALDVAAADGAVATSAPLLATADAALCKLGVAPSNRARQRRPRFDGCFAL